MTAGAYIVTVDGSVEGRSLRNGVDTAVVYANSAADAKAITEATLAYTQPAVWAAATATLAAAAADMAGWRLRVRLTAPPAAAYNPVTTYTTGNEVTGVDGQTYKSNAGSTGIAPPNKLAWTLVTDAGLPAVDQTVTGAAAATVDAIAALMATALNADPSGLVANAAYNSGTNVLTCAGAADNLGAYSASVEFYAAGGADSIPIPGFLVSKSDGGSTGSAVTATLVADSYTVPQVVAKIARS